METTRAFGSAFWFWPVTHKEGPWVAPLFTFGFMMYLAALTATCGVSGRPEAAKRAGRTRLLRGLVTFYIIATGIVEITRFLWDVSRFALVWAALHNLPEWGIILFTLFQEEKATKYWWYAQAWILAVTQWVLFAPTLTDAGLGEQIAGLTCDWLLVAVWWRLHKHYEGDAEKQAYIKFGLMGAIGHMLEILPLVSLLIGLVSTPSWWACVLIAFTQPITFYLYSRMVDGWEASPDPDLVTKAGSSANGVAYQEPTPRRFSWLVAGAVGVTLVTLIGPVIVVPPCQHMLVPPGGTLPASLPYFSGIGRLTNTSTGLPGPAAVGTCPAASAAGTGTNQTMRVSHTKLAGFTTVKAKRGSAAALRDLLATMPGPVRQEPGSLVYEQTWDPDTGTMRFYEEWTSVRTMYQHIYSSPTVARTFYSEEFKRLMASQVVEGPFKVMVPASVEAAEAQETVLPFSTVIDAPVDCLWKKIDNWGGDYSWVDDAQGVTLVSPTLRILHFPAGIDVPVLRQSLPLPAVEQPRGGHRLVYFMLSGAFMDTIAEIYKGTLTITPSDGNRHKTLLEYTATVTAKNPGLSKALEDSVRDDFTNKRMPFLRQWGRQAGEECQTRGMFA